MKGRITTILSLCLAANCYSASISNIVKDSMSHSTQPVNIGIVVENARTDKILYKKNPHHLFTPASTLKLFTASAALDYLGANYRFHTYIMANNKKISQHKLSSNIYFKFNGDPSFSSKDLKSLIGQLKKQGIERINGRVYLDTHRFDQVPYAPGWIWDDLSYSYAASMNAALINENCFAVKITPSKHNGWLAKLTTPKLAPGIARFQNTLITRKKDRSCVVAIYSLHNNHYWVNGCYKQSWKISHRKLGITDARTYARILIRNALLKAGIHYQGRVENGTAPYKPQVLAKHSSKPLSQLLIHMMKKSDNLYADSIFKTLGANYFKTQGTWQNAEKALDAILAKKTHINFKHTLITDGAGLSRYDLVTPLQIAKLLEWAYHDNDIAPELLTSLPIAGTDGTLKYRMKNIKRPSLIRAKTGTMGGVTTLAGYATRGKKALIFVIMINNFVGKARTYRRIEDQIGTRISQLLR